MTFRNHMKLRLAILGWAMLLGLQAAWMILPDMLAHRNASGASGDAAKGGRAAAELGARLGLVRGDLWADVALSYSELAWPPGRSISDAAAGGELDVARAAARRALEGSPHDARLWLLLAALDVQRERLLHQHSKETVDALKMAYYTAPNDRRFSSHRLMIAARSGVSADQELRPLVGNEIRLVLTRWPELKPAVVAAYEEASPAARTLFEDSVRVEDPKLLEAARPASGAR